MTEQQIIERVGQTYLDPEEHYDLLFGDAAPAGEIVAVGDLDDIARHLSEEGIDDLIVQAEAELDLCAVGRRLHAAATRRSLHRAIRAVGRSA